MFIMAEAVGTFCKGFGTQRDSKDTCVAFAYRPAVGRAREVHLHFSKSLGLDYWKKNKWKLKLWHAVHLVNLMWKPGKHTISIPECLNTQITVRTMYCIFLYVLLNFTSGCRGTPGHSRGSCFSIPPGLICACQQDCSPAAALCPFVPPLSGTLWPSRLPATHQWMLGGAINNSPQLGCSNSGCKCKSVFKLDMNM